MAIDRLHFRSQRLAFLWLSSHGPMIVNARAFSPEQAPRDLHHRDVQIDHLLSALDLNGTARVEEFYTFGSSDASKTPIAKCAL